MQWTDQKEYRHLPSSTAPVDYRPQPGGFPLDYTSLRREGMQSVSKPVVRNGDGRVSRVNVVGRDGYVRVCRTPGPLNDFWTNYLVLSAMRNTV